MREKAIAEDCVLGKNFSYFLQATYVQFGEKPGFKFLLKYVTVDSHVNFLTAGFSDRKWRLLRIK